MTTTIAPEQDLTLMRSRTHDSTRADLSRPLHAATDEARAVSKAGYVKFEAALQPVMDTLPEGHVVIDDPEKAKRVKDLYLVTWLPDDPEDPRNWSTTWRWYITGVAAISVIQVAFASAVITGDFKGIERDLHVGSVVTALSVSLMVCGFGCVV